jgi:hypothetical protein
LLHDCQVSEFRFVHLVLGITSSRRKSSKFEVCPFVHFGHRVSHRRTLKSEPPPNNGAVREAGATTDATIAGADRSEDSSREALWIDGGS